MTTTTEASLDRLENFPGWSSATQFMESFILDHGLRAVADIGGGANPILTPAFLEAHGVRHTLMDISDRELQLAPAHYDKVCADICSEPGVFLDALGGRTFDLIFSHMFLEHIADPSSAHRNLLSALRPGGYAVHMYPTPNSLPFAVNRLVPDALATVLLRLVDPKRDLKGRKGKFPAFYAMCAPPSRAFHDELASLGYEVDQHIGYVGHDYYERFPVLSVIEKRLRGALVRRRIPLTSYALLVLRRPMASDVR
jgi:SAM-dependent methyltransferase